MTEKKMRQDILEELLRGTKFDQIPGLEELNDLVRRCASPDGSVDVSNKPSVAHTRKGKTAKKLISEVSPEKTHKSRKTTYYLAHEIFDTLDLTTEKIKEFVTNNFEGKVSKSSIVNQALQLILNDFDKRGAESALVKQLLKKKGKIDKSAK